MSDIEITNEEEFETTEIVDADNILDVTIIEDVEDEVVVDSAFDRPGRWYIVHTFAGHEQKVIGALNNIVKSRDLTDQIYEIYLPEEDVTEFKNGKKVTSSKRMFPSYLLVRCEPDPEIFYVIGSTPGVTGFVGAEKTRPTALTRREVDNIIRPQVEGVEQPAAKRRVPKHEFEINDTVQIKTGPFATFSGHVAEINDDQLKVKVLVDIFGRETPVELDFTQVTKL
jgi:transcription termination/antitermination protein NusG